MKPHIKLSVFWKTAKDQADPFAASHKFACKNPRHKKDRPGFGATMREAFANWLDIQGAPDHE